MLPPSSGQLWPLGLPVALSFVDPALGSDLKTSPLRPPEELMPEGPAPFGQN
jgi:hypothetical protein